MVSMSKEEMIQYLKDYACLQLMLSDYPDTNARECFKKHMLNNNRSKDINEEYFKRMFRVYNTYIYFKSFSIIEDFLLNRDDFLSNNDLKDFEHSCTFYEKPNDVTTKRIIQLIRNAFNHNNNPDFDRFKISANGKYLEIEFKDIRTEKQLLKNVAAKPIKFKFDREYLGELSKLIGNKSQNLLFSSFNIPESFDLFSDDLDKELDNVTFIHYYFVKKLSSEQTQILRNYSNVKGYSNEEINIASKEMHHYAKSLNPAIKEFNLNTEQKEKIKALINTYKKNYPNLINNDNKIAFMYYILQRVIPIPGFKHQILMNQLIISEGFLVNGNLSFNNIIEIITKTIIGEYEDNLLLNKIKNAKNSSKLGLYRDILDEDFRNRYPLIMYIDAVVTHLCQADEIVIDGITYNKEKLRNSFVHGRWFIGTGNNIVMYDADPRNINDYNLEFVGKIDIISFTRWAINYEDKLSKEKGLCKAKILTKSKNMYDITPMSFYF